LASLNNVLLLGNCIRDPEVKYTPSGTAVCDLGMAVNEKRKNASGEWVDEVTYVDVTTFGRTAEVAGEYLKKGAPFLIEGKLKLDQWQDKSSGQKRSKLKVVCDRLQLLGGKGGGQSGGNQGGNQGGWRRQQNEPSGDNGGDYSQTGPDEDAGIPF